MQPSHSFAAFFASISTQYKIAFTAFMIFCAGIGFVNAHYNPKTIVDKAIAPLQAQVIKANNDMQGLTVKIDELQRQSDNQARFNCNVNRHVAELAGMDCSKLLAR